MPHKNVETLRSGVSVLHRVLPVGLSTLRGVFLEALERRQNVVDLFHERIKTVQALLCTVSNRDGVKVCWRALVFRSGDYSEDLPVLGARQIIE